MRFLFLSFLFVAGAGFQPLSVAGQTAATGFQPLPVADQTFKLSGTSEFVYAFAEGDQVFARSG
ncbi:MAG: hypothetical protein IPJ82_03225 [Lewinellaceae bacterium]|nr:hypothetical protein [Lewinellaceae bacterium]